MRRSLVRRSRCLASLRVSARTRRPGIRFHANHAGRLFPQRRTGRRSGSTLDAVVAEGAWPGSRTQLIDTTNLGKYFLEVIDPTSNRVIYSRGFATIYGEWETTPEFRTTDRTFHESRAVSTPDAPVRIAIKKRDAAERVPAALDESTSIRARRAPDVEAARGAVSTMLDSGPPSRKVDLLLISDGYALGAGREVPRRRRDGS